MNKFELEKVITKSGIKPEYLDAYRNKILNLFNAFFENLEANLEYEHEDKKDEHGLLPSDIQEDIDYRYNQLSLDCVTRMCCDLCISDEIFENSKIHAMYESEIPYVAYCLQDVWTFIKNDLDNVSFLIATISLLMNVSESTNLGKWFIITVKQALKEYKFYFILDEILKKRVFIAMSFDKSMQIARNKIKQAVLDSGYIPVLIDEKEHNNSIVPEIFYEIEKSDFIIADFTGNRGGVYYEAGYAKALKKEIIMTVRESDFNDVHFDTKQVNHIIWKSEDELYEKIVKRIEATM